MFFGTKKTKNYVLQYHCFLISTGHRKARNDFGDFTNFTVLFSELRYAHCQ
jgi:hypothetical protein